MKTVRKGETVMTTRDLMREPLKDFTAYVAGGKQFKFDSGMPVIKLNANENQMGPGPKAMMAMSAELGQGNLYPMETILNLKRKISKHVGFPLECITTFSGSGSGIQAIGEAFLNPDDEMLVCSPTYMAYYILPKRFGAKLVEVEAEDGVSTDLDKIYEAINDKTKLIFICNPNNPTGTLLDPDKLFDFIKKVPEHVITVVDEAYIDWIADDSYPSALKMVEDGRNLIILRTFSKIYGLAGCRVGYAVANAEVTQCLGSIAGFMGPNRIGAAGAAAALEDYEYYNAAKENNTSQRTYLTEEMEKLGITVVPSSASFIYFAPHCDTKECMDYLESRGVFIRYFSEEYIRVSIGLPWQNKQFLNVLTDYLRQYRKIAV